MLRGLIERFAGLAVAIVLVGLPMQAVLARRSPPWILLTSIVGLWLARLVRRLMVSSATSALARGDSTRARRLYRVLWATAIQSAVRQACKLSLAACDAAEEEYEKSLERLEVCDIPESETSLQAVALNLRAYCLARTGTRLEEALALARECVALRAQVQGFRHTRGLLLLELGRYEEAIRDLEATWGQGQGSELFESERCFDLGRLWALRGQDEYARDYFARALRACPEGRWAQKASQHVGPASVTTNEALENYL